MHALRKIFVGVSVGLTASAAIASVSVSSVMGTATNMLAPVGPDVYANMTFNQEAGTTAEATSKGLEAIFEGSQASRTTVLDGMSPYNVQVYAPGYYDGDGYFGIGVDASLTLSTQQAMSAISVSVGTIDSFNMIQIIGADLSILGTYSGTDLDGGVAAVGARGTAGDRRITFTGLGGTALYGIKFYNEGNHVAFEFDNVTFMTAASAVPEPSTWATMLLGLGMLGLARRRTAR
jgi:PEP-CTERM motif